MADSYAEPADVRQQLEREGHPTDTIEADQLAGFLDEANMLVEEELTDTALSERRLKHIEACLAGHYILDSGIDSLRQATRLQEHDGTLRWFGENTDTGLQATSLGRRAIEYDTTGRLAEIVAQSETVADATDFEFRVF